MRIITRKYPPVGESRGISRFPRGLLMLSLTLLLLLSAAFHQAPRAHAVTNGPLITWDGAMIYQGQNNNNPEGPVGETAVVHGQNFTANAGQQLKLVLVAGDNSSNPAICQGSNFVATVGNATVSSSGDFSATFNWPGTANHVNGKYSICSLLASDGSLVSSVDSGPFTVLSASAPTVNLSTSSVAAGDTLTISGKSWVPPQPLNIIIAGCADCDPGNSTITTATTSSAGLNAGSFSVNVPIPAASAAGNYVVNVLSQNGPLDANRLSAGTPRLAITAPQATPTPTPSPTATVTATATAVPTSTPTGNNNNSSGSSNGFLLFILIAMAVLLLTIIGIIIYIVYQRNKQGPPPDDGATPFNPSSPPGVGAMNSYSGVGGPMTPFPPGPANQNQFVSSPDNRASYGNWQQGDYNNMQQGQQFPQRTCVRCGSPLNPNNPICGRCGTLNSAFSDPDSPTIAY